MVFPDFLLPITAIMDKLNDPPSCISELFLDLDQKIGKKLTFIVVSRQAKKRATLAPRRETIKLTYSDLFQRTIVSMDQSVQSRMCATHLPNHRHVAFFD